MRVGFFGDFDITLRNRALLAPLFITPLSPACTGDDSSRTDTTRGVVRETDDTDGMTTLDRGIRVTNGSMTEGPDTDSGSTTSTTSGTIGTTEQETGDYICPPGSMEECNMNGVCNELGEICICDDEYDGDFCGECAVGYEGYPNCELGVPGDQEFYPAANGVPPKFSVEGYTTTPENTHYVFYRIMCADVPLDIACTYKPYTTDWLCEDIVVDIKDEPFVECEMRVYGVNKEFKKGPEASKIFYVTK